MNRSHAMPAALAVAAATVALAACAADPVTGSPPHPSTAAVPEPPQSHQDTRMLHDHIPGLRTPRAGVLTGGQPEATAWPLLADGGVGTVINLRPDAELDGRDVAAEAATAGLDYVQIPVAGAGDVTTEKATALWQAMQAADGPVLVHCASGNRVGALMALAAVEHEGLAPEEALALGREAGLTSLEPKVRELLELPPAE